MIKNFTLLTFIFILGSCSGSKITAEFFNNTLGDIASNDQTELIPQIEQHSSQYDPSNTNDLLFEITFSREIKPETFDTSDIENAGSATNVSWILRNAGDNKNFTLRAAGSMTEGTVIPLIPAGVIVSADDEKTNISSISIDNEITYDTTPVSVVIDKNSGDPSVSLPIEFSIAFSEPVNLASFSKSDITITGSATVTLDELINSGDNQNFTYRVLSTSSLGDVDISINAMALTDLASNPNNSSTHIDNNILYAGGGLSVNIEQAQAETVGTCIFTTQADPSTTLPVNFKVTFSDQIDDSTFTISDITQAGNANVTNWTITNCGDDQNYLLSATAANSNGAIEPEIAGGVVNRLSDAAGNVSSYSTDNSVSFYSSGVVWSGLGADDNWSTAGNWIGGVVPGASDTAVFNGSCTDCDAVIDSSVNVGGLYLSASYSGTLSQAAGQTITIGGEDYIQESGTFVGNDSSISISQGSFKLIGGEFTSTKDKLLVRYVDNGAEPDGFQVLNSAIFNHNNGIVELVGDTGGGTTNINIVSDNSLVFNDLILEADYGSYNMARILQWNVNSPSLTVSGDLSFFGDNGSPGYFGFASGEIAVQGDVFYDQASLGVGHVYTATHGTIRFVGSANQQVHSLDNNGRIARVVIDKSSGSVTPAAGTNDLSFSILELESGTLTLPSDFSLYYYHENYNGILFSNKSGTTLNSSSTDFSIIQGSVGGNVTRIIDLEVPITVNSLTLDNVSNSNARQYTLDIVDQSITTNNFTSQGSPGPGYRINISTGEVVVNGNMLISTGTTFSTGSLTLSGSSDQTVSMIGAGVNIPALTLNVNKASGAVVQSTDFFMNFASSDLNIISGVWDMNGFDLTVNDNLNIGDGIGASSSAALYSNCGTLSAGAQNVNPTDGVIVSSGNNPNITISDTTIVEGGNLEFTVSLSEGVCTGSTSINYTTSSFYSDLSDYTDNDSTLVIPSGSLSGTITVVTNDDALVEPDEVLRVNLTGTNQGTITDDIGLGFILDNETPTHIWTGDSGDGDFNNPLNWSGGAVPTNSDVATFNDLCNDVPSNCNVNLSSTIDVLGLEIKNSYTGTFTQGLGHIIDVGSFGFYHSAGNFIGGNSKIDVEGNFYQRGGSFTSTSGEFEVGFDSGATGNFGGFSLLGGSFSHNNGSINLSWANNDTLWWQLASYNVFEYEADFNDFSITASRTARSNNQKRGVNYIKGSINVLGDFLLGPANHTINGDGEIRLSGNFSGGARGNSVFRFIGGMPQSIAANSNIPGSVVIDSTSNINFLGDFRINNDFEYIRGSVNMTGTTAVFGGGSGTTRGGQFYCDINSGPVRFSNVTFNTSTTSNGGNINISGTMIVDGDLTINNPHGQHKKMNGGAIDLSGDLILANQGDHSGGDTVINLVGSSNQTVTSSWTHSYSRGADSAFPSINVASTGGTVTFSGEIPIANDLTYTSGVVDLSTSHFFFIGHQYGPDYESTISFPGHSFNDVTFRKDNDNISIVGNMDINGNLVIHDSFVSGSTIDGGSINLAGDLTLTEVDAGGSTQIIFDGTTDQNITYTSGTLLSGNMTVNKSAGSIIQGSNLNFTDVSQVIQINDGDWNMNGFDLDINNTLNIGDGVGALSSARLLTNCGTLTTGSQTVNPTDGEIVNLTGTANITINNVSEAEGTDLVFTVSLSQAVCGDTNITYTTNNQSASAGTDYTDNDSTLVIASGATSGTITVVTNNDTTYEQDETLRVSLTGTNQGTITDATGIGTIENDDTHPYLWTGAGGNSNWTTGANWYGGTAPGTSNVAYFNDDCVQCDVNINANISVRGIDVSSSFTGTITQNSSRTITIGDDGWRHRGGSFVGGNSTIDFPQALTGLIVTGGSFTSTSGNLNMRADDFRVNSSATFNHNSGTIRLHSNNLTTVDVSSHELWNFTFDKSAGGQGSITTSIDVNGTLRLSANSTGNLINGTIFASGDVIVNDNGSGGESTRLRIDGSSDQLISASGGGANSLSGITFASTGGTVTMQGSMQVRFEFRHISGNVDMSNSTIRLVSNATATLDPGPIEFNNLFIYKATGAATLTEDITVLGDLRIGTDTINGNYDIFLHGDFYLESFSGTTSNEVFFVGNNDQTISRTSGFFLGSQIVVNKTGGKVTQISNINLSRTGQDLVIRNGIWDMAGYNLTVNDRLNVGDGVGAAGSAELISNCGTISSGTQTANPTDGVITTSSSNPNITINDVQVTEGNNLVFTVSLTEAVCGFATNITYRTDDGTARAGDSDYTANTGTLIITSGSVAGTITVSTTNDSTYEDDEIFYLNLTSADQGSITDSQAIGTILNDESSAGSFVWTGLGPDDNWTTPTNWSGGSIPNSGSYVIFDNTCTNCNAVIDNSIDVAGLALFSSFSGTVTQSPSSIISTRDLDFNVSGGTFNASGDDINMRRSFLYTGGSINLVGSALRFNSTNNRLIIPGAVSYNNVSFDTGGGIVTVTEPWDIDGELSIDSSGGGGKYLNGKNISLSGNLIIGEWTGGDATIVLNGSVSQNITGGNGVICGLEINSTGTVNFFNTVSIQDDFLYTKGTVNWGSSSLRIKASNAKQSFSITSNGLTFNNLEFESTSSMQVNLLDALDVDGSLILDGNGGGSKLFVGNPINLAGDLIVEGWNAETNQEIILDGSGIQDINLTSGNIVDLTISSTGTINVNSDVRLFGNFTYNSGTVNWGSSILRFDNSTPHLITSNGLTYGNVLFEHSGVVSINGVMNVDGTFYTRSSGGGFKQINGDNILLGGDIDIQQTYTGTSLFVIDGTSDQSFSQTSGSLTENNLTVNKPSGEVLQETNISLANSGQDLNIINGTWNMNGFNLTVNDALNIGDGVGVAQSAVLNQGCSSITSGTTIIDPIDGLLTTSGENPVISISNASAAEGSNIDFNVTLSEPVCSSVTNISFLTDDDIASISDSDYIDNDGTLIIPAGASSGTISISTTGDSKIEVNETLLVTLTSTDQGSLGTSVATGTINNDDLCPSGFVPVNGDENLSTNTFCVMAFEAKDNSGDAVSEASATPWVSLSASDAQARCSAISEAGYSGTFTLISNPEWMTIARDIERTPANWEGEAVGSGHIYRGHSDNSPSNSLQVLDELDPFDSTGNNSSQAGGSGFEQGRAHALTGGSVIWDFAGNVWEWTDWLPGTSSFALGPVDETASSSELSVAASGSLRNIDYKPNNDSYSSANSFGRWSGGAGGGAIRGGAFDSTLNSGAFALDLSRTPASVNSDVGFRCVYREKQAPIAYDFTAPDGSVDSESVITLQYADFNYDLGVSCTTSNFSNVSDSTPCSCDGSGVCTVGITGDVLYTGPANFDFTITDSDGESNTATVNFTINP